MQSQLRLPKDFGLSGLGSPTSGLGLALESLESLESLEGTLKTAEGSNARTT